MEAAPLSPGSQKSGKLKSVTTFECTILPTKNSISGTLVPRVISKQGRRRIVSVETHQLQHAPGKASFEECIVRVLVPASKEESRESKKRARQRQRHEDTDESVSDGASTVAPAGFADHEPGTAPDGWKGKYRFPISALSIKGTHKRSVDVEMNLGKRRDVREIIFDTLEESEEFQELIETELQLDQKRSDGRLQAALGAERQSIKLDEAVTLLVEVVSGSDLPAADIVSSDPFVACLMNGKEIHRTKYISKTLDPIWTVETDSLFLIHTNVNDLFRSEGLLCIAYDFDKLGANDALGSIVIPPQTMYHAKGERIEYKLEPPPGKVGDVSGTLALRIRHASAEDQSFIHNFKGGNQIMTRELETEIASKGGASNFKSLVARRQRVAKTGTPNAGRKEYKIRPGPDPERPEETSWMTQSQIEEESTKESTQWVDAGTGRLGRLYVEVLGCDDLPNLDAGGFAGNKTDCFVMLVYEDSALMTDIIDDCLSPRWMPWSKRAFVFHIYHSSSQLFLGIFDYDDGINPTDDHDLVGRVSVDLSNLQPDTMYTMTYNIYTTARMTQRKRKGTVTIRLRLEIDDERKLLLSAIEPPPQMYVNVKTRKEFRAVRYTTDGKFNMEKYSMKVINSYVEELLSLQHVSFYIQDALTSLLLWRSSFSFDVGSTTVSVPVHSISLFLIMITLVERPQMIPSFCFGTIAWMMLATQAYRRGLPDLWSRCKSFQEFVESIVLGKSLREPDSITVNQNSAAAQAFLRAWEKRVKDAEEAADKAYQEQLKAQQEYEREMEEIGEAAADATIATHGGGGVSIDPFKSILFPVQQNLAMICRYVRHVKHVISWQESYIAFWVTSGSLLLSFISLFIPWFFIIKWTARIVAWSLFGPWMKLVDIFYVSKIEPLSDEQLAAKQEEARLQRRLVTESAKLEVRMKRESQTKLKAMKKYLFGKFIVRVPVLKEDRFRDIPLPTSHAEPYHAALAPVSELAMRDAGYKKIRIPGQHLVGDMIPKIDTVGFTDAPPGQATTHPSLVDKSRPGGSGAGRNLSTTGVYALLVFGIVVAVGVTYYVVPWLGTAAETTNGWIASQTLGQSGEL